jgi:hypothetical protein
VGAFLEEKLITILSLLFGSGNCSASKFKQPENLAETANGRVPRFNLIFPFAAGRNWLTIVCFVSMPLASFGLRPEPAITSPTPGSVLPGSSVTFTWTSGTGTVSQYTLLLGTTGPGSQDAGAYTVAASGGSTESASVSGIPTSGATLYVELQWQDNKGWQSADYIYTEASTTGLVTPLLSGLTCSSGSLTGAGTDACTVSLAAAAGTGGLAVSLASNNTAVTVPPSVTVAAGASSAGFTASVSAVSTTQTATLTATAGATAQTYAITLNAVSAALTLGATSVPFGNVNLNTMATQPVTLTSSGTAALTISAASVTGAGFSISGMSFPVTLNPGQSATLDIGFDPTVAGTATGAVTLTSNATPSTATISLSGTGQATAYQVNLTWNAPAISTDPVAGYNVYRADNGSSSYQLLNSSVDATTAYSDTSVQSASSYSYYVESVDAQGNQSGPSNTYTVSIP